jgi:glycosyltransferase involved in cell wall biosynthesis
MNRVDFVTSVGHESMNDLIRTYDYPPEKTKVIKRGVPVLCFDKKTEKAKLAHEFGFQFDTVLLLHVGQFSPEKNHQFLLDAFNLLSKRIENIHLLLVGEGKLYSETKQWVSDNSLAGKIHFAGYRNPVQQIMAGADLFLLSSLIEGVPGVIIEAGMQKLPAVAIEVGGVGEVVIKDQTGVLIPTHDLNTFAAQAERLIQDEALRLRLGNAAHELATSNYSLEKCAVDFENLYLSLLKQKR